MAKNRKVASKSAVRVKRAAVAPVQVDVVEEQKGMGWEGGVAIVTTLLLIAAILVTDYELGTHYGAGVFFKP